MTRTEYVDLDWVCRYKFLGLHFHRAQLERMQDEMSMLAYFVGEDESNCAPYPANFNDVTGAEQKIPSRRKLITLKRKPIGG